VGLEITPAKGSARQQQSRPEQHGGRTNRLKKNSNAVKFAATARTQLRAILRHGGNTNVRVRASVRVGSKGEGERGGGWHSPNVSECDSIHVAELKVQLGEVCDAGNQPEVE